MKKVNILKVKIESFRNLEEVEYSFENNKINSLSGLNGIGKTNVINAIYWCLTGVDLFNSSNTRANLPIYKNGEVSDTVSVIVELNVGKIKREAVVVEGSLKESISINDEVCDTLKEGEVKIDELLGTLELAIKGIGIKEFNVRRFLLNPLYISTVDESTLRKFIISLVKGSVEFYKLFSHLSKLETSMIKEVAKANNYDPALISKEITDKIKECKTNIADLTKVEKYLKVNHLLKEEIKTSLVRDTQFFKKELGTWTDRKFINDKFADTVSEVYDNSCMTMFDGIVFRVLEKNASGDSWNSCCYPLVKGKENPISLWKSSTSERIMTGIAVLKCFRKKYEDLVSNLPVIFDECETLDNKSLKKLKSDLDSQVITAKVKADSKDNNIEKEVL